jgi:hypothetical protein
LNLRALSFDTTPPADYEPAQSLPDGASLTEIADHYGTDKGSLKHNYAIVYERVLGSLVGRECSLLEIGVACGASLKMWSHWLPKAQIDGIDIRPECAELCQGWPNIHVFIKDATKQAPHPDNNWDVIIDDGSHVPSHIIDTFRLYWPRLKSGGVYVIEDLFCTYNEKYMARFPGIDPSGERAAFMSLVDAMLRQLDSGHEVVSIQFVRELMIMVKGRADG